MNTEDAFSTVILGLEKYGVCCKEKILPTVTTNRNSRRIQEKKEE